MNTPSPEQIARARRLASAKSGRIVSQRIAAERVYVHPKTWQNWEYGVTEIPLAAWELFHIKFRLPTPE